MFCKKKTYNNLLHQSYQCSHSNHRISNLLQYMCCCQRKASAKRDSLHGRIQKDFQKIRQKPWCRTKIEVVILQRFNIYSDKYQPASQPLSRKIELKGELDRGASVYMYVDGGAVGEGVGECVTLLLCNELCLIVIKV